MSRRRFSRSRGSHPAARPRDDRGQGQAWATTRASTARPRPEAGAPAGTRIGSSIRDRGTIAWRVLRRSRWALAALAGYLVAAIILTAEAWRSPTTQWAGICCDPEQTIWFLGWVPYAIAHGLDPFFTTMIGAPDGVNLMWNTGTPLLSLLAWLPTQIGGPVFAYNVMLVAGIAVSGWAAYFAVRRYAGNGLGPVVGGAVYAFSPYVASHAALHLNLTTAWVPPLFLLVLDELLVRRRRPAWQLGVVLGLLSVAQLLIAEEILATSVLAAGILVLVLAIARRDAIRDGFRRLVPALAAATVTFLVVGGWPLATQFLGPQRISEQVQDPDLFSTDLLNIILPTPYQTIAPDLATDISRSFSGLFHEATAYVGIPLLVLVIVAAARRRHDLRIRVATIVGLILLVLSLGSRLHVGATDVGIPMPWLPFGALPLVEHVLPGRLTVFVWLAVAGIVAIITAEASRRRAADAAPRLVAIAAAVVFILPAPLPHWAIEIPGFFRNWSGQGISADETVLVAPYFRNVGLAHPMVWAAAAGHGVRMPEAYAYVPAPDGGTSYGVPATQLSDVMETIQRDGGFIVTRGAVRAQIATDLRDADIRHVIVGPMEHQEPMVAFFTDLLGRAPVAADGVLIWRGVDVTGVDLAPPD